MNNQRGPSNLEVDTADTCRPYGIPLRPVHVDFDISSPPLAEFNDRYMLLLF